MNREQLKADLLDALRPSTPPNVGEARMESMAEAVLEVVADLVWSKMGAYLPGPGDEPGEFDPYTWRRVAGDREDQLTRLRAMAVILTDLNRCEHGRHQGDTCASGCAGGTSLGNPVMRCADAFVGTGDFPLGRPQVPLRTIGFDRGANPIVVPDTADLNDPDAWRTR